jgi:alpha-beta hydrolase superfamily lysophospholipase
MKAAENSLEHAADLRIPLLLMHGSEDMISSPEGSRQFASASKTTELKIWDGGYHELHNESFRDEVFEYLFQWIDKKID